MELTQTTRKWIVSLPTKSIGLNLFLAFAGAVLTAICAQIIVPLPFTPVPMTMQVFAVLAIAGLLGPMYGGISQVIYIMLGLVGLPWCAGGASLFGGLQLGISAGYLAGFVAAAGFVGYMSKINNVGKSQWKMTAVMLMGLAMIYLFGGTYFAMATGVSLKQTLSLAIVPFIIPDLMKVVMASALIFWIRK